jgi:hypothetical protein
MKWAIERICELLPPPTRPVGLDRPWRSVEAEIGTKLPTDYKHFIDLYGSGLACKFIFVWNYRDRSLLSKPISEMLLGEGSVIRGYERTKKEGRHEWKYAMYPSPNGLLPFATIIDVDNLNWLTTGHPDEWDVVYWFSDGQEFIHLKGDSLSAFLLKLLRKKYRRNQIPRFDPPYEFRVGISK